MNEEKYFNFPVQLLVNFLGNSTNSLNHIFNYSIYKKANSFEGAIDQQIEKSFDYFDVSNSDPLYCYNNGSALNNSIPLPSPMVGISKSVYFDFYKNNKEEFEKVCLLAYLAIKSIVQNKPYCKIDNKFLLARMDGKAKSISDYSSLSPELKKYANEYQTRKIKDELVNSWGLVTYSRYTRGFYVSFSLSLNDLVFEAEKRRKSTKLKQAKAREKEALKMALNRLN